ncbi:MAG: hypothetical protein ACREMA_06565, partial [Longimicrobiales bacterium]
MALPLVLAGPIVRRVEARLCTIWIALSEAAEVEVTLWDGAQFMGPNPGLVASGDAPIALNSKPTRRFGEHLHVAVVTVPFPNQPMLPGHTYSYDVEFSGSFGNSSLRNAGLLKDEKSNARIAGVHPDAPLHLALGYLENRLPSFIQPGATLESLRIVHASCRRPGATSQHDAMAWLDDIIKQTQDDTLERPQQLYLTGDQIYADDVQETLLPMLNGLGQELLGPEELPVSDKRLAVTLTNFPAARRSKLLRFEAKFSTGDAANHLMSFGEY